MGLSWKATIVLSLCALVVGAAQVEAADTSALVTIRQLGGPGDTTQTFPGVAELGSTAAEGAYIRPRSDTRGSAYAGGGMVRTYALTQFHVPNPSFSQAYSLSTISEASLSDRFVVTTDAAEPITMSFLVGVSGVVTTEQLYSISGAFGLAEVNWSVSLRSDLDQHSVSGGLLESRTYSSEAGGYVPYFDESGIGLQSFLLTVEVAPGAEGTTFDLAMSAMSRASGQGVGSNDPATALADFGHSLAWGGLVSATLPTGEAFGGSIGLSSDSGYDYLVAVPEPAGAVMLGLYGLFLARRRTSQG